MERPLIRDIERFLREEAMSATTFGRLSVNDPRLVEDLRAGRSPGERLCQRVRDFMRGTVQPTGRQANP